MNHFFADRKPVEIDRFLAMPPHVHLLYLNLHAYKHFVRSGIGLWTQEYHSQIDWQRLHDQRSSVHVVTFTAATFRIARDYLGIEFDLPAPWGNSVDVEPLLHDTLRGGVYSSNDYTRFRSSTVTLNTVRASRASLARYSPNASIWKHRYPYLKKHPYPLPVAWVQRIAHYAGEKQPGEDNCTSGSIKPAMEQIELMKRYGIMD